MIGNFYHLKNISVLHSSYGGTSIVYTHGEEKHRGFVSLSFIDEEKGIEVILIAGNPDRGYCVVKPREGVFVNRSQGSLLVDSEHLS